MKDEVRGRLSSSLFASTSAFVQSEQPMPEPQPVTQSPSQQLSKIAALIEDAMDATTDDELLPILHEALEEARRHA